MIGFNRRFDGNFGALKRALDDGPDRPARAGLDHLARPRPAAGRLHRGLGRAVPRHDDPRLRPRALAARRGAGRGAGRRQLPGRARDRPARRRRHGARDPQDRLGQRSARSAARGARPTATTSASRSMAPRAWRGPRTCACRASRLPTRPAGTARSRRYFFIERYAAAYLAELDHFAACLEEGKPPSPVRRGRPPRAGAGRRRGRIAAHRPRRRAELIERGRARTAGSR